MKLEEVLRTLNLEHMLCEEVSPEARDLWQRRNGAVSIIVPSTGYTNGDFSVNVWFPIEKKNLFFESVFDSAPPEVHDADLAWVRWLVGEVSSVMGGE